MKKFLFVFLFVLCLYINGCSEKVIEDNNPWEEINSVRNSDEILSNQEKCHKHLKEAQSLREGQDYVNVYYSPKLNTCILDLTDLWREWEWVGDLAWTMEWTLKDFYLDKEIFSCTMFPIWSDMDDVFLYDKNSFDEDTISLFKMYWENNGQCNYLYDRASDYLKSQIN